MEFYMNFIYKILLSFIFCAILVQTDLKAQGTIGPLTSDYRRDLTKIGSNPVVSYGELLELSSTDTIGRSSNIYKNAVYQWTIPDNMIPDNSTIDSLQISFLYNKSDQYELPAALYSLTEDITNGSTSNLGQIWTDMNTTSQDRQTGSLNWMIYNSNNPNNPLNLGFKNSLSNDRFVLGIRWDVPSVNRLWFIYNDYVTIKVHFTPPQQSVFIDQLLSNGTTRIGKIKLWEGSSFSAPLDPGQSFNFYINSHQVVRGDTAEYSGEKYNNWNTMPDVRNQHDFLINTETNSLTSWFKPNYYGVKVRNAIEGLSDVNGGILYFKDPWLIDSVDAEHANTYMNRGNYAVYNTINSPLDFSNSSFSNFKGIFLNQPYDPANGKPCYMAKLPASQDINLGSTLGTRKFYFQNYSSSGATDLNQNKNLYGYYETPIVFTSNTAVVNANLKGVQLSSTPTAFESNSQRKIVRTVNTPALFQVYESMGYVYLERSTDNGQTWDIYNLDNPGKPISNYPSYSPSIDYLAGNGADGDYLIITFEESGQIKIVCIATKLNLQFGEYISDLVYHNNSANPVVSGFGTNRILVIWKDQDEYSNDGLVCRHGTVNTSGSGSFTWSEEYDKNTFINNSNQDSRNPSLNVYKSGTTPVYRLAWDDNAKIYYCDLIINGGDAVVDTNYTVCSDYTACTNNSKPSIIAVNGGVRLTWIGTRTIYVWGGWQYIPFEEQSAAFIDPSNLDQSWAFGEMVQSVSINKSTDCYSIAWGRSNSDSIQFTDSYTLQNITSISNKGAYVQVSNGGDKYSMIAASFNNDNPPYYFTDSHLYSVNKSATHTICSGREAVVSKGKAQFYFGLGDIKYGNKPVDFIALADTLRFNSSEQLNNYLTTKPIRLTGNSTIDYTIQFGYTDSIAAANALKENKYVNFKVELVDAMTNQLISVSDSANFSSINPLPRNNRSYQFNTAGLANRIVKLRLKIETNTTFHYSLKNRYSTNAVMNKIPGKNPVAKNLPIISTYELSQNYPNPFNPSTTIEYQIPAPGNVSLKVFDLLGKEVTTLINESRNAGRYSISLDASKLASGVYIYQLKVNDYVSSKKMMLLK
jgi:hypothetical protein